MYYKNFSKVYDKFMQHCNYDEWADLIKKIISESDVSGKNLLDLGCGTGETLLRLKDDFQCTGLDLSTDMLTIANKKLKNKNVKLFAGDMRAFDTGEKYDIIVSLFDTVNHLTTIEDLEELMICIKNNLNPGGIYIFDVINREFMNMMFPGGVYYDDRKDMTIIWEHFQEDEIDVIEAVYFVKNRAGHYEKLKEMYEKRIFTHKEIENILEKYNLNLLRVGKDDRIAGERFFYVVKK
ncbi:class I SAM-dependent methyltransferase [uncultured Cetobacterium sp.]|uniref:class I SAM-dependent DNA methyltransferase n=1 Tax=uncultured Cetobacterium sp. TaxID=527638 RepID=UPI0026326A60|nr:class I SAM-dependent methyltransferase [uncultured Cetobacterium sp.]